MDAGSAEVGSQQGCAGALLVPLAVPAQAAEIDLEARMHSTTAFPNARGHAEFENENSGNDFEISIAGVRALAGTRVTVRVHGTGQVVRSMVSWATMSPFS